MQWTPVRSTIRQFIAVLMMVGLGSQATAQNVASPADQQPDRPDIVLVLSDDQTWTDAGVYGHPDVKTPNIDQLASQGMRFMHCFTATAMCAPARQQLYTGLFPVRSGAYPNHSQVNKGTKSMVHYLRDLGYRVGLIGKKHFGPGDSFPFEFLSGKHHDGGIDQSPDTEFSFTKAKAFIERDAQQPYCLVVASNQPHLPWNRGDVSQYDPEKLTLPPYLVDTPETREALARYYAEVTYFDQQLGRVMNLVKQSGRADNTMLIYTSEQGAQFPRGKWTCYDTGLRTATVIRWPGRIKPGSVTDAMVQYVDIVPTLVDAAGGAPIDGLDGRSFLDVLLGRSDAHRDAVFGIHTTRGIINGSPSYPIRSIRTRDFKLIWNLQHEAPFMNVLQTGDSGGYWKSWVAKAEAGDARAKRFVDGYRHRPQFELYDLRDDPHELNNLADAPAQADRKKDLHARLKQWMQQQGDEGIATELAARERQGRKKK